MPAASIRARVRAEMIEEIKATARRHLAAEGANLSLRAVARDMGMVSSALYRYFASRDDLLTTLIIDAYNALGGAAEAGDAAVADRADLRGRWLGICHAVRRWALANPAEYALIFGSPVPGYAAPVDTTGPAARTPAALVRVAADGLAGGALRVAGGGPPDPGTPGAPGGGSHARGAPGELDLPDALRADLRAASDVISPGLPEALLYRVSIGWIHLFGAVSFELFGQLTNVIDARADYFDQQMRAMADLIGLP